MARIRGGGSGSAYAVSLFLLGAAFFFSLVLAILFKTQVEDATFEATEAKKKLVEVASPNELSRVDVAQLRLESGGGTVVGKLLAENARLKQFLNASPKASLEAIQEEAESNGVKVSEGQTLLGEVRRLQAENTAANDLVATYKDDLEAAERRLPALEAQMASQAEGFEKAVEQLKSELALLQGESAHFRSRVEAQQGTFEEQLGTSRQRLNDSMAEMHGTVDQRDRQITALNRRIEVLTSHVARSGASGSDDAAHRSDGTITADLPEEGLVYIDRGSNDRVRLGMTFEVFASVTGVNVDPDGEVRGLATVEVIETDDSSALARVVRLRRGAVISEGDLIANVAYDPDLTYQFYVYGQFDLDEIGRWTDGDRRRVEAMVTGSGGGLTEGLTFNTDFLVLGREPRIPEPLPPDVIDPQLIEEFAARERTFRAYQDLIAEAKALAIPVLNQNRFLALIGYYQR